MGLGESLIVFSVLAGGLLALCDWYGGHDGTV